MKAMGGGNEPGCEEGQKPGGGENGGSASEPSATEPGISDSSLEGSGAQARDNVAYSDDESADNRSAGDYAAREEDARGSQLAQTGDDAKIIVPVGVMLALASFAVLRRSRRRNLGYRAA